MNWNRLIDGLKAGSASSGRPAPQKPLLLIYLLARAGAGLENGVEFAELQKRFRPWLSELTNSKAPDPLLPFWHMQGDGGGGWRVEPAEGYSMQKGANRPIASSLKERGARGFLAPQLWDEVAGDLGAAEAIAKQVCARWLDPEVAAGAMERFRREAAHGSPTGGIQASVEPSPRATADRRSLDQAVSEIMRAGSDVPRPLGNPNPKRITVAPREEIVRDPTVVAYALQRARERCEDCGEAGPFVRRSDGTVYLEVHHLIPLANGGSDTVDNVVAVCPNCHRRLHLGIEGETRSRALQALRKADPSR